MEKALVLRIIVDFQVFSCECWSFDGIRNCLGFLSPLMKLLKRDEILRFSKFS